MENATKALIIAAAILIAIVLIALGVKVLGSSSVASEQSNNIETQMNGAASNTLNTISGGLEKL